MSMLKSESYLVVNKPSAQVLCGSVFSEFYCNPLPVVFFILRREMSKINKRFLEWLCCGDVGQSSKAIAFVMFGLQPEIILKDSWTPYPHDAGDFGRCYKLLKIFSDWRSQIIRMKCLGKIWESISVSWDELEKLYESDEHKKLYKLLTKLQSVKDENCDVISIGSSVKIAIKVKEVRL